MLAAHMHLSLMLRLVDTWPAKIGIPGDHLATALSSFGLCAYAECWHSQDRLAVY